MNYAIKTPKKSIIVILLLSGIIICIAVHFVTGNQYCMEGSRDNYIDGKTRTLGNHYAYSTLGAMWGNINVKNLETGKVYAVATNMGFCEGYDEPFFSGEYIYYFDSWDGELGITLFRSSINDNSVNEEIVRDLIFQQQVTVGNNTLYFCDDTKIKGMDLETGEEEEIFDLGNVNESTEFGLFKYIDDDLYLSYENKLIHIDLSNRESKELFFLKNTNEYVIDLALQERGEIIFLTDRGLYSYSKEKDIEQLIDLCIDDIDTTYYSKKKLFVKENQIYFNDNDHSLHCYDMRIKQDKVIYEVRGSEEVSLMEYHFCDDYILGELYQYNSYGNITRSETKLKYQ